MFRTNLQRASKKLSAGIALKILMDTYAAAVTLPRPPPTTPLSNPTLRLLQPTPAPLCIVTGKGFCGAWTYPDIKLSGYPAWVLSSISGYSGN